MNRKRTCVVIGSSARAGSLCELLAEAGDWQPIRYSGRSGLIRALIGIRSTQALILDCREVPHFLLTQSAANRNIPILFLWDAAGLETIARSPEALLAASHEASMHLTMDAEIRDRLLTHGIRAGHIRPADAASLTERLDAAVAAAHATATGLRVAVDGLPYFAKQLLDVHRDGSFGSAATYLRTASKLESLVAAWYLARAHVWYTIGPPPNKSRLVSIVGRILRKRQIFHWVGTDIVHLRSSPNLQRKYSSRAYTHLAENDGSAAELRDMGLHVHVAPLPVATLPTRVAPMPATFTLLMYVPPSRSEHYGEMEYLRLIADLKQPDIRFCFVGGTLPIAAASDSRVFNYGTVANMQPIYDATTVLLRLTRSDGLSFMVLEALAAGRYVCWSKPLEECEYVTDYEDLKKSVLRLYTLHNLGRLPARQDSARRIGERYSAEAALAAIEAFWERTGRLRSLCCGAGDPLDKRLAQAGGEKRDTPVIQRAFEMAFRLPSWNIGIVRSAKRTDLRADLLKTGSLPAPMWLPPAPGLTFLADPFVWERDGRTVVFAELFDYRTGKGHIGALDITSPDGSGEWHPIIREPHHLSYPYLFQVDGSLYCAPEASASGRLTAFACVDFPYRWERAGTLFDQPAIDASIVFTGGLWWLFCTFPQDSSGGLHAFWSRSPMRGWSPHRLNPIKVNSANSRPAGALFHLDGALIRPAQDCSQRYGSAVVLNEVRVLTPNEFSEIPRARISPHIEYPAGLHTVNATGSCIVVDGLKDYWEPRKPFLLARRGFRRFGH
ncbi:MAG TPA: hypothetical protein VMW12_05480 [Candidatus Dormibacteraeota bacterium]|nr:hypothetical protein [Candidatus Dormibacteraeota bacterium]